MDPQIFSFMDSDLQKYADPRIRIQRVKYQLKTAKKNFLLLKPKSELLKKEFIKISSFMNGLSFKNKTKNLKIIFCFKIQ